MSRWRETLCGSRIKNISIADAEVMPSKTSEVLSCEGKFYANPSSQAFVKPFSVTLNLPTGEPEFLNWHSVDQQTRYSFKDQSYSEEIEVPDSALAYFENKYMK
jgi:hypothetical protein